MMLLVGEHACKICNRGVFGVLIIYMLLPDIFSLTVSYGV
jgi:hypothetical protein